MTGDCVCVFALSGLLLVPNGPLFGGGALFPEWRVALIGFVGSWERNPSVVVGSLDDVRPEGSQYIERAPWPVPSDFHRVYWCSGELRMTYVVRGTRPTPGKRFLWASLEPGCSLEPHGSGERSPGDPATEVWLLREEGQYLRPVVDAGASYFVRLRGEWKPKGDASREFGELLLTPGVGAKDHRELAEYFFQIAQRGCAVLGREGCLAKIQSLVYLGDRGLREAACKYLATEFQRPCKKK